jgi:glycosyltransferase involved in cell wall biosynthesis
VEWKPWTYIDKRDKFNILIVWRMPEFCSQFTAKKMFVDMHDVLPRKTVKPYKGVTYLFKSQYHKDLYENIENFAVIPNGIKVDQFKQIEKKPYSVIYPSAYYRGLETLVNLWPKIKEQVPEATLDIYYGWESWVTIEGEDDFYHRMCKKLNQVKDLGVTEHGRVDHKRLAKRMAESKVWAYPTEFPEIFCITAVKANLAGCKPVITDVAALAETGGPNATYISTDKIYKDEYSQEKFVKAVVKALQEDSETETQIEWAKQFDWSNIAEQWVEQFNG